MPFASFCFIARWPGRTVAPDDPTPKDGARRAISVTLSASCSRDGGVEVVVEVVVAVGQDVGLLFGSARQLYSCVSHDPLAPKRLSA